MQTRTKKTLATTALGLAFAAAAAGSASAASPIVIGSLPVGSPTNLVPGAAGPAASAQNALANGASGLSGNPTGLLPSNNHVAPVAGLLGGLPIKG